MPEHERFLAWNDPHLGAGPAPRPSDGGVALHLARIETTPAGRTFVVEATRSQQVHFDLYDVAGRHVRRVFEGQVGPGALDITWDGRLAGGARAPSGLYGYRLSNGERTITGKFIVAR